MKGTWREYAYPRVQFVPGTSQTVSRKKSKFLNFFQTFLLMLRNCVLEEGQTIVMQRLLPGITITSSITFVVLPVVGVSMSYATIVFVIRFLATVKIKSKML